MRRRATTYAGEGWSVFARDNEGGGSIMSLDDIFSCLAMKKLSTIGALFAAGALTVGCMNPAAPEQDYSQKPLMPFPDQPELVEPAQKMQQEIPQDGEYDQDGRRKVGEVKFRVHDHKGEPYNSPITDYIWTPVYVMNAENSGSGLIGVGYVYKEQVPGMDKNTVFRVEGLTWNVLGEDLYCPKKNRGGLSDTNLENETNVEVAECRAQQITSSIRERDRELPMGL